MGRTLVWPVLSADGLLHLPTPVSLLQRRPGAAFVQLGRSGEYSEAVADDPVGGGAETAASSLTRHWRGGGHEVVAGAEPADSSHTEAVAGAFTPLSGGTGWTTERGIDQ